MFSLWLLVDTDSQYIMLPVSVRSRLCRCECSLCCRQSSCKQSSTQPQPARIAATFAHTSPSCFHHTRCATRLITARRRADLGGAADPVNAALLGSRPPPPVRSQADLLRRIYTTEAPANACVRLLNATGEVGCAGVLPGRRAAVPFAQGLDAVGLLPTLRPLCTWWHNSVPCFQRVGSGIAA